LDEVDIRLENAEFSVLRGGTGVGTDPCFTQASVVAPDPLTAVSLIELTISCWQRPVSIQIHHFCPERQQSVTQLLRLPIQISPPVGTNF